MTETQLLEALIGKRGLARILGWRVNHQRPAMIKDATSLKGYSWRTATQGAAGFPDLVLVRPPRCIIAELKGDDGKPTGDQVAWLDLFSGVEVMETYLVKPSDLDEFQEILLLSHVPNLIERASFQTTWKPSKAVRANFESAVVKI